MKLINFACALESFRIEITGDKMRIEGWLVAHPELLRLDLVFGGDDPVGFEIHDRGRESEDVFSHFGRTFGEASRACRFLLVEDLPSLLPDWDQAALRVTGADGTVIDVRLDPPENLALVPATSRADGDLVARFESIGDNCEFGLFQRQHGVARTTLLSYAGVADVFALADAIEHRFAGFAEGSALHIRAFRDEWMAAVPASRMNFHTGRAVGEMAEDRIRTEERRTLQFLAGKLIDDIEEGSKIFVYRTRRDMRGGRDGRKGMDRLYEAMRAIGPARLLWVNEADGDHPPGTVIQLRAGLYCGFVARLAPHDDAAAFDAEGWRALLALAAALIDATTLGTIDAGGMEAAATA